MTTPSPLPPDDAVEQLLREFFSREMPPELRSLPDTPSKRDGGISPRRAPSRRRIVTASLAAVAACSVIAVVLSVSLQSSLPTDIGRSVTENEKPKDLEPRSAPESSSPAENENAAPTILTEPSPSAEVPQFANAFEEPPAPPDDLETRPLFVAERLEPLDRITVQTAAGPVEQRTELVWTDIRFVEPQSGTRIDYAVPSELTIEIFPLDGEAASPLAPQPPSDRPTVQGASGDR